ncbi:MAG TPA: PIN domain-containing protein [Tepidisphaeraceae bacterium]|nr:PIN domain-containing protein [Tepidisphaeraceae bacterium]
MSVLVDTSVLSLAFRRRPGAPLADADRRVVEEFAKLAEAGDVVLIGAVRQEALSGIRSTAQFDRLRDALSGLDVLDVRLRDHDEAARCYNACGARGIIGGSTDMLLCATAIAYDVPIFSTDADFESYAACLRSLRLHRT